MMLHFYHNLADAKHLCMVALFTEFERHWSSKRTQLGNLTSGSAVRHRPGNHACLISTTRPELYVPSDLFFDRRPTLD